MKKLLSLFVAVLSLQSFAAIDYYDGRAEIPSNANPNRETLHHFLYTYLEKWPYNGGRITIKASADPHEFQYDLVKDADINREMQSSGLLSYFLYIDGVIVIDEISPVFRYSNHSKYHSQSIGKTITSYIAGHAICAGYIESVDSQLNDWPLVANTLYNDQRLIDLLNMSAGDQRYATLQGLQNSNRWINSPSVESIMDKELKNSTQSYSTYNYNNLVPNTVGAYIKFKAGENYQDLLDDVFQDKVKIQDDVFFMVNEHTGYNDETFWYQFYGTRSDYLRIAKAMLDDWQNDTCEGQYLKTLYERRVPKNGLHGNHDSVGGQATSEYAGFFHTGYMQDRMIMGMDGFGGQSILIDFENGKIIATQAIHQDYNWKKIVYEKMYN